MGGMRWVGSSGVRAARPLCQIVRNRAPLWRGRCSNGSKDNRYRVALFTPEFGREPSGVQGDPVPGGEPGAVAGDCAIVEGPSMEMTVMDRTENLRALRHNDVSRSATIFPGRPTLLLLFR